MRTVPEHHSDAGPPRLRVFHEVLDGAVVVTITGEVDMRTSPEMEEQLLVALDTAGTPVVADLTGVSFLDSIGLSALVRSHQLGVHNGNALRVVAAGRAVLRPLQLTALDSVLDLYPTLGEALAGPTG
jgi:anti-sigma B factor antagonist